MTPYNFQVTIPANAAAPVNLAVAAVAAGAILSVNGMFSATYLPASKITFQMAKGGTGVGYVGGPGVTYQGAGAMYELTAATVSVPGSPVTTESQKDHNVMQLQNFNAHGGNPGDVMNVTYYQD